MPDDRIEQSDGASSPDPEEVKGWRLAEEFDRRAREERGQPDPELLAAVAAAANDEVLNALLGQLGELCGQVAREAADRYVEHLIALAALLGTEASSMVRAAVGVQIADLCARTDDFAGAKRWVLRSAPDLADLPSWLLGDYERVLARVAESEGRQTDVFKHAKRARDLFAKDERWDEAAGAADLVAGMHSAMTAEAMDDCRRAAELNIEAGFPEDAQACVRHAGELLLRAIASGGDATTMVPLCSIARDLARAHQLLELAARIGLAMAAYAGDSDQPWVVVRRLHEQSKQELSALNFNSDQLKVELARVDLFLGRAALAHGLGDEAAGYLSAAGAVFRETDMDDELQACEVLLYTLGAASRPNTVDEFMIARVTDPDLRAGLLLADGLRLASQGHYDEGLARLTESTALMSDAAPYKSLMVDAVTAAVHYAAGDKSGAPAVLAQINNRLAADDGDLPRSAQTALKQVAVLLSSEDRVQESSEDRVQESSEDRALEDSLAAFATSKGTEELDLQAVDVAINHLRQAIELTKPGQPQLAFHLISLALGLYRRSELSESTADLQEARTLLAKARIEAGGPAHPQWRLLNEMSANIDRLLGETPNFHFDALEGLRGRLWEVLLQPDLPSASIATRNAATDAISAARTCLIANDPSRAITELESGRGLALFAATEIHSVADKLDKAGDVELAQRWRKAAAANNPAKLSSELRRDVLTVITAHSSAADMLHPLDLGTIQNALAAIDADALIYLMPGDGAIPGYAVAAPVTGSPSYLALPNLNVKNEVDVERYLDTLFHRNRARSGGEFARPSVGSDAALAQSLDRLCNWAWNAAMGPIIESYLPRLPKPASGLDPRVVLVPIGDLARIPWHAAQRKDGKYAAELIAISQAASARMLGRTAAASPVHVSSVGLVVGDPDTDDLIKDLPAARLEALAIRQTFYRGARYLGRRPDGSTSPSGAGTPNEVRAWLTAADLAAGAILHLACHGLVRAGTDPTAYLLLAGGQELTAQDVIACMEQQPNRAIGLVVLSGCFSGPSNNGYDEAYSLSSALLASGVRSVLSIQWSIDDNARAVMMFMFHYFLRTGGLPSWAALRETQLWMLNRRRVIPEVMPAPLRDQIEHDTLHHVVFWAAFVHWGQ